jgi:hypothetical protein
MGGVLAAGRDTWCVDEYKPGRYATGKTLLGQRCYHRLTTRAGTLRGGEEEADFGFDLAAYIGSNDTRELKSMLPVRVKNELMKDPTVNKVTVVATFTGAAGVVTWTLTIHVEGVDGEVDLIVRASAVTVQLLGIS